MQSGDMRVSLKVTIKEKLGSGAEAAATQKLLKQQITRLERELKVSLPLMTVQPGYVVYTFADAYL